MKEESIPATTNSSDNHDTLSLALDDDNQQSNPSTDVAAVTIDEDDDAAADTTSSVIRSACDHFSTSERVTLYHRIMSEQFTVGKRVRVQYGTNASEFWFPAVIGRQNPDGTYQIIYQDSDESDATASNKAPERIKADCDDYADCECDDDDDYDYADCECDGFRYFIRSKPGSAPYY
jgi:hypothetical protein